MQMLGVTELIQRISKVEAVRWYGYILQREEGGILEEAFKEKKRPKTT